MKLFKYHIIDNKYNKAHKNLLPKNSYILSIALGLHFPQALRRKLELWYLGINRKKKKT
jgi:hypothetical protein